MSSFEEAFSNAPTASVERLEASVRERHPDVFEEEEVSDPVVEELEPNEFRYDDDGTQHR
jgi:hypothetical protein